MIQQVSLNSRKDAICSPIGMPAAISFGFEDMIKMKAELGSSMLENAEDIWKIILKTPRTPKASAEESWTEESFGYQYGILGRYDIAEELAELRRRKNRR